MFLLSFNSAFRTLVRPLHLLTFPTRRSRSHAAALLPFSFNHCRACSLGNPFLPVCPSRISSLTTLTSMVQVPGLLPVSTTRPDRPPPQPLGPSLARATCMVGIVKVAPSARTSEQVSCGLRTLPLSFFVVLDAGGFFFGIQSLLFSRRNCRRFLGSPNRVITVGRIGEVNTSVNLSPLFSFFQPSHLR